MGEGGTNTCVRGNGREPGKAGGAIRQQRKSDLMKGGGGDDWVEASQSAMWGKEGLTRLLEAYVSFRNRPAVLNCWLHRSSLWETWHWRNCGDGFQSVEAGAFG